MHKEFCLIQILFKHKKICLRYWVGVSELPNALVADPNAIEYTLISSSRWCAHFRPMKRNKSSLFTFA